MPTRSVYVLPFGLICNSNPLTHTLPHVPQETCQDTQNRVCPPLSDLCAPVACGVVFRGVVQIPRFASVFVSPSPLSVLFLSLVSHANELSSLPPLARVETVKREPWRVQDPMQVPVVLKAQPPRNRTPGTTDSSEDRKRALWILDLCLRLFSIFGCGSWGDVLPSS